MIFGGKSNTICSFREKITFRRPLSGLEKPPDLFPPPMFECGPAGSGQCSQKTTISFTAAGTVSQGAGAAEAAEAAEAAPAV